MTYEDWASSRCARTMLASLYEAQPDFLRANIANIHRLLLACCWKHQHLIPQEGLRNALHGAEKWLAGDIDKAEMNRLDYYAESAAFALDYARTSEDFAEIQLLIDGIDELRDLPFEDARKILPKAAYFAECSAIYPFFRSLPWVRSLMTSVFLCPDLLRAHIAPRFDR